MNGRSSSSGARRKDSSINIASAQMQESILTRWFVSVLASQVWHPESAVAVDCGPWYGSATIGGVFILYTLAQ